MIKTTTFTPIKIVCRSRFLKFKELRTKKRQNSFSNFDDEEPQAKKKEKEKLLGDLEIEELSPKGKRLLWMSPVEEIKLDVSEIQSKMKMLDGLHAKHLKVSFEMENETEREIEILTQNITTLYQKARAKVQKIAAGVKLSDKEVKMRDNLQHALAKVLQDLSNNFRNTQESYLKELSKRNLKGKSSLENEPSGLNEEPANVDQGFNEQQMVWAQNNYQQIVERDKELQAVARSIRELAQIFNDLAILVVDQGTVLDRIDYNIEQAVIHTEEGEKELEKALANSKTSKIRSCILLVCVLIVIMTVLLIIRLTTK